MMRVWSLCLIFSLSAYSTPLLASPTTKNLCRPDQRDALLEFKSEFSVDSYVDPSQKKTEMWRNHTDCCSWDGISCDLKTGEVVKLQVWDSGLNGPLRSNSSLFKLHHLRHLELGYNNLTGTLPDSIGSLVYLRYLNLGGCDLFGKIPSSLGNLSYLTYLHLDANGFTGELPHSLGNLKRLTFLAVRESKLSGSFPHALLNLSSLTWMDLTSNRFEGTLPSNMSSLSKLKYFDIRWNSFSGSIPSSLFMIPSLSQLYMGSNRFEGTLPSNMSSLSKLEALDVGQNSFSGSIPWSLFTMPSLQFLYLENNHFSGSLETGNISSATKFKDISLGGNNINGPIPGFILKQVGLLGLNLAYINTSTIVDLSLFSRLTSLDSLDLSGVTLKISSTLHLPSLGFLALSSCNIVEFPVFLQNQTILSELDISANQIEGQVPEWLWSLPQLTKVKISHNSFTGFEGSTDVIRRRGVVELLLDISSNSFQNPFPLLPNSTWFFMGSNNRFSGEIPRSICELLNLEILDLSNNNFSGSIPRCFSKLNTTLWLLHLQNNNLSGIFPEESVSVELMSLNVGHNQLSGRLPKSLANCIQLKFLNLEYNRFNDTFPSWVRLLPELETLVLRSNEFHGAVSYPGNVLRIFDVSGNRFNGVLPSDYFAGWTAVSSVVYIVDTMMTYEKRFYEASVVVVNKGLTVELVWSSFAIYKVIDVSGNRFEGDIPESIGLLKGLIVLNMSNNAFRGPIPTYLANLSSLQSLDLSQNKLSGRIPPELGKLTFLARMNFSHNKLEGPIPQGTQIQSQDSSSFADNPGLCGVPLPETCGGKEEEATEESEVEEKEEKEEAVSWIAAAIGYVPGVFCGLVIAHILASSYKFEWFLSKIFRCFT